MVEMQVGPRRLRTMRWDGDEPGFYPAGSVRHHSIGTGADCNRKTDDAVRVCAGAVELDDADMEIEMEAGIRRPDRKAAPEEPTAQERAEHMFTHMPFRSWCQSIPRCSWTLAILVAKDWSSTALMWTVVTRKTTGEFVSKRVVVFMKELGCEMRVVTLKTDDEPALVVVADDVAKVQASRGAQRTIVENSLACCSKSNGVIERGVQTIQGGR